MMWTHVMSMGMIGWGSSGEIRTVAGASVGDRTNPSTADATSSGHARGQTTWAAVWPAPAPSAAAMSRSGRHGRDHVAPADNNTSHPNRARYAMTMIGGAL